MKTIITSFLLLSTSVLAQAQKHESIRNIRAVPVSSEVNLLDSVKSENYERLYKYNEYGYITSLIVRNKYDNVWEVDTDNSYIQDYVFNTDGRCISRTRYAVDKNGQRQTATEEAKVVTEGDITWERYYDTVDGKFVIDSEYGYDKWGNLVRYNDYLFDYPSQEAYLYEAELWTYTNKMPPKEHYNYSEYQNAYLISYTHATSSNDIDEVGNPIRKMEIREAWKKETVHTDGCVYVRRYEAESYYEDNIGYSQNTTLDDLNEHYKLQEETRFYLNAEGNRPVRKERWYCGYEETELCETNTYEWDSLNRLIKETETNVYNGDSHSANYTYADDYAPAVTLDDIINGNLSLYPEQEEPMCYGHTATYLSVNNYEDESEYELQTAEYENGRLKKVKWEEYTMNADNSRKVQAYGEQHYFYNNAGHGDCFVEESHDVEYGDDIEYFKMEYVYNANGVWTGIREYSGESLNGPWYLEYYDNTRTRHMGRSKAPINVTDMSEGFHDIRETNGVWNIEGHYYVENGVIVYGEQWHTLISNASRPQDPDTYYTIPAVPLESEYDCVGNPLPVWHYEWDRESGTWKLEYRAHGACYNYISDNQIRCDSYNENQELISTSIYTLDNQQRLISIADENDKITHEYFYLAGDDNYLDYSIINGNTYNYYYSIHNYVSPTGIDTIRQSDTKNREAYSLSGQRVLKPVKGIYIINGRKVLVK